MWIKFLKRLLFYPLCAILATATLTYLYSYPHAPVTWLLVAAGWSIHTQFYHVAVQDWLNSTTLRQSEDAVRSRALVYAYMGDCSSAMDVYEHELGPLRQTLHFNGEFVEYQPNEVADLVAIYNDCAGETERTFALTEEAQKRLMDTIRLYNDLMMMNNKSNDNNTGDTKLPITRLWRAAWSAWEMSSGRVLRSVTPVAVTNLMTIPVHSEYLRLLNETFSQLTFSSTPALARIERHWQTDVLSSVGVTIQAVSYLYESICARPKLFTTLLAAGAFWRYQSIKKSRYFTNTVAGWVEEAQNPKSGSGKSKNPVHKLALLERARQMIVQAPTRDKDLLYGVALAVLGEAIKASFELTNIANTIAQTDEWVAVYMDLWQAKKVAEQQMPPEPGSQTFANPLPHANPAYAYEIFVRTPVEARYAAGQIDDYQAYQKMVSERHDIWTELNLSKNITWQVETLSGQRPAAAASIDDSEF
mmetsp:Transcript_12431/g.23807  ORF Transcript_12431/g.23807 Transcript_12431/m.23807 type:complete len:474 (+) Transcript_12431:79-1500(+)